jgi:MOSC domain-containing protein YiiM
MPAELFASLSQVGFQVAAGALGENITTAGLDLERMPLGTTLIELGPMAIIEPTVSGRPVSSSTVSRPA